MATDSNVTKYRKYLVSFMVTFGAGLTPLWVSKAGYTAILDFFPESLRDVIPWASFLMSVPAVGVQFFGGDAINDRRLKWGFGTTYILLVLSIFALYFRYEATVIRLYVPGAHTTVSYLVGSTLLPTCECAKRDLDIRECIASAITINPYDVAKCYPRQEIASNADTLSGLYMLMMFAMGTLIGLLVLKQSLPKQPKKPRRTRKARAKPAAIKVDAEP